MATILGRIMKLVHYNIPMKCSKERAFLYPEAGLTEKNHIQICIRNPNCIKSFFLPRELDLNYFNP